MDLTQAIAALDDADDKHWNKKGEPNLQYILQAANLPKMPNRAEADAVNPRRRNLDLVPAGPEKADATSPSTASAQPNHNIKIKLLVMLDNGVQTHQPGDVVKVPSDEAESLIALGSAELVE